MEATATVWPTKVDLFGVQVSLTDYSDMREAVLSAAEDGETGVVSCHAVHAIITASGDPDLRRQVNTFRAITPDGQPVRWALNSLHRAGLNERVYGPDLMLHLCEEAAQRGVSIYLYGGSPDVVETLQANLREEFPTLKIPGFESPPYRELSADEDEEMVRRINDSGAKIVFIGLGCPKQDRFAYEHRDEIQAIQVCVGAAFDFHAGKKSIAPAWMQKSGLEWLFRLASEPRRLWRRYLYTNSIFIAKFACALTGNVLSRLISFRKSKSVQQDSLR